MAGANDINPINMSSNLNTNGERNAYIHIRENYQLSLRGEDTNQRSKPVQMDESKISNHQAIHVFSKKGHSLLIDEIT